MDSSCFTGRDKKSGKLKSEETMSPAAHTKKTYLQEVLMYCVSVTVTLLYEPAIL